MLATPPPAAAILERIAAIGDETPDRTAFVVAGRHGGVDRLTYGDLVSWSHAMRRTFEADGLGPTDLLVIGVRNHITYLSMVFGAWLAAIPVLPISPNLTPDERDALLELVGAELGRPVLVDPLPHRRYDTYVLGPDWIPEFVAAPEAYRTPGRVWTDGGEQPPYLFLTSGGTTGLPKVMEYRMRFAGRSDMPYAKAGLRDTGRGAVPGAATRLITGNLFHTGNFAPSLHVLLTGSAVITMTEFDPRTVVELLRANEVYSLGIAPSHMMAVLAMPDLDRSAFAGLSRVTHGAAPCPHWVKRGWMDLVGPERLFEIYYSSELGGAARPVIVNGTEWLQRPGTVGRPEGVRVVDEHGRDVPAGTVGEIYFPESHGRAHSLVGGRAVRTTSALPGHVSVADLGWLDEDGYLFLADRMSEVLEIEGRKVVPSAVEEVIASDPDVADVAVVGTTTEEGRMRLYALVQPRAGAALSTGDVLRRCRNALEPHEIPADVRFTDALPRTEEGKMRRSVVRSLVEPEAGS
ncbi:class I adenylate-forming enzyme family protein [Lentzea sp. JNUCC 0626]|uniref:class I adenylate-forming enzyme family protein n=1 Tax=Lentzea sp. JNUCC 0626 TaxID=3367513 RepID=UPI003749D9EF